MALLCAAHVRPAAWRTQARLSVAVLTGRGQSRPAGTAEQAEGCPACVYPPRLAQVCSALCRAFRICCLKSPARHPPEADEAVLALFVGPEEK